LFAKAFQRYLDGPAAYGRRALSEPTARRVAAAVLTGAIETTTRPGYPSGCLSVQGALAGGAAAAAAGDLLRQWRATSVALLRGRFQQALDDGDLPPGTDPAVLARYVITVSNGIAVQAATGAGAEDLHAVAQAALDNWPAARRRS
jgi:hypothetical protein